eukprot:s424_g22.t1
MHTRRDQNSTDISPRSTCGVRSALSAKMWAFKRLRFRCLELRRLSCSATLPALGAVSAVSAGAFSSAWWVKPTLTEGLAPPSDVSMEKSVEMVNWSGTQQVTARQLFAPENEDQLQRLLRWATEAKQKMRPVGMNLSPNGLALQEAGMLSMTELDQIKGIDKQKGTITVQAGARAMVLAKEQQIAGWTQVSAHGTGARIPPVDEMILSMTVVSPSKGVIKVSEGDALFPWMRVGLGALAVVQEMTLKVIPRYVLHERTFCYMWVPYIDTIVVVVSDVAKANAKAVPALPEEQRVEPLKKLLLG